MSLDDLETLTTLLRLPGPTGDESAVADWLEAALAKEIPDAHRTRLQDNLLIVRGDAPRTAIFAHLDTTGFTLGYDRRLIPIGGPEPQDKDSLRCTTAPDSTGRLRVKGRLASLRRVEEGEAMPGTRWVYAREPVIDEETVTAPYLDNRAGVWSALRALTRLTNVAVAFTTGEEQHGSGARVCAEWLYRNHGITQALIADLTWHTDHTPCGKGVVISLRDAFCPRQAFLDRILALAAESDIPYQREIQSAGSSDGGAILRSSVPMDWVFIGAPERRPHTAREQAHRRDLDAMADLLTYLTEHL